jgi:hypothetical protein
MLKRSTTSSWLPSIATQQSCATVATIQIVYLQLDYVATYPSDGIIYQASDMVLCAHSDAGFLNETNSCSHNGAHIFLSENEPFTHFHGAVLSIAQIIKFVIASVAKSTCSPFCNGKRNDSSQANPHLYGVAPSKKPYLNR